MSKKYYLINHLLERYPDCQYYVVYGERSNGKTYSTLRYFLNEYFTKGHKFAYIRRWKEDIKQKNMNQLFTGLVENNEIYKLSKGKYTNIVYRNRAFYLVKEDKETKEQTVEDIAICYIYVLTEEEHDKGVTSPDIKNILFDEFIARRTYLPEEFVTFTNVLSSIIRDRNDVKIIMLGNTINRFSPYFTEMGLTNVKTQEKGTVDIYTYGDSGLKVAVEFSDLPAKKKRSDIYFAFNNPKLQMITKGTWEIAVYPHLTKDMKYLPKDIKYIYFIEFDDIILQCEIVKLNGIIFTFIHQKTTPIKDDTKSLVYTFKSSPKPNYRRNILKPFTTVEKAILDMFKKDKVFYQNNEIGDVVRNYINNCMNPNIRI